jgi:hypothetical protein
LPSKEAFVRRVSIAALVVGCVLVGRALAGGTPEHLLSDEALIPGYEVALVATVTSASEGGTNGEPPTVGLKVEQQPKVADDLVGVWRAMPHDVDWSGDGAREALEKWAKQACPAPKVGEKLILFGKMGDGKFWVSPRCRYQVSDEKLAWVKKLLKS